MYTPLGVQILLSLSEVVMCLLSRFRPLPTLSGKDALLALYMIPLQSKPLDKLTIHFNGAIREEEACHKKAGKNCQRQLRPPRLVRSSLNLENCEQPA